MTIKSKKILLLIVVLILSVVVVALAYNFRYIKSYVLNLSKIEDVECINISSKDNTKNISTKSDFKVILNILNGTNRVTKNESVNDVPVNVDNIIKIELNNKNNEISTIFLYEKNSKYYLEQPYNGIYEISVDEYNSILNYLKINNISINNYYTHQITQKYDEITKINADYTLDEAIKDECFVINHAKVYNENLYEEFMRNYKSKKNAFIRLVKPTVEGDIIIYDIKYDSEISKIIVIEDNTRDKFSSQEDRNITIREYDNIGSYKYKDNLFWVAYTGEINDETFKTNKVLTLATIN